MCAILGRMSLRNFGVYNQVTASKCSSVLPTIKVVGNYDNTVTLFLEVRAANWMRTTKQPSQHFHFTAIGYLRACYRMRQAAVNWSDLLLS